MVPLLEVVPLLSKCFPRKNKGRRMGALATMTTTTSSTLDQMRTFVRLWASVTEMTQRTTEAIMANEPSAKRQIKASFLTKEIRSLGSVQSGITMTAASVTDESTQKTMLAAFDASPQIGSNVNSWFKVRATKINGIKVGTNRSAIEYLCQESSKHGE